MSLKFPVSAAEELLSSDGLSVPGIMVLDGHSGSRCVDHLVERPRDGFREMSHIEPFKYQIIIDHDYLGSTALII